jgi:choline transport protein
MSALGWLASVAGSTFVVTTMIQAMIEVTQPDFGFPNWQYTLIMLAFLVITIFFNTWGAQVLPMVEIVSLIGHLAGFIVTIVPLWVLAPKNPASDVFAVFVNNGGWSNTGTACLISQVTVMYCSLGKCYALLDFWTSLISVIGSDSVVHICE